MMEMGRGKERQIDTERAYKLIDNHWAYLAETFEDKQEK